MKKERTWELVSLKLSGEATAEELDELQQLLEANPELSFKEQQVNKVWEVTSNTSPPKTEAAFDRHLQRLSNHLASPAMQYEEPAAPYLETTTEKTVSIRKRIFRISTIAATLVITTGLIYFFNIKVNNSEPIAANIITTKPGSKSKINLPDGTLVWLNADSKITYNEDYNGKLREVELIGEAYFDVFEDKNRPFIIHTKSINIKVLGTAFNVRSYPNENTSETSIIRGLVEVTLIENPDKKIILKPNEKLVVKDLTDKLEEKHKQSKVDETPLLSLVPLHYLKGDSTAIETSWTKNKLAFDGETLENVAKIIERWYGVKIILKDEQLKNEKYTSVFEDESLSEVLNALQLTGNFKYSINRKEVTIKPNN